MGLINRNYGIKPVGTAAGTVAAGNHTHTGVYSADGHNHDSAYSAAGHNHNALYVPIAKNPAIPLITAGTPTDSVTGTGEGTCEAGALYVQTGGGPLLFLNVGDEDLTHWHAAGGTLRSGAGAPTDGVTDGDTDDFYEDTTAYGSDPETGWYRCTDGTANTWAAFAGTIESGAGAPTDSVEGTGQGSIIAGGLVIDGSNKKLYINTGTTAHPVFKEIPHS